MKKISAALMITDGEQVLVELATGRKKSNINNYDLPKGEVNENEDPLIAAIRETKEETGLDFLNRKDEIQEIGLFPYSPNKDIYLCAIKLDKLPKISDLHCDSYFDTYYEGSKVVKLPEVACYYYIHKDELIDCLYYNWRNTLTKEVLSQIFEEEN